MRCGDRFLHYNYVCALLNDLYGVQSRGGCQCAGPYSQRLLGMTAATSLAYETALIDKHEFLRPGYTRLSLTYFMDDAQVDYILGAVDVVARMGWRLMPAYRFNHKTGEWKHHSRMTRFVERIWSSRVLLREEEVDEHKGAALAPDDMEAWMARTAAEAERIFASANADSDSQGNPAAAVIGPAQGDQTLLAEESLRWCLLPSQVLTALREQTDLADQAAQAFRAALQKTAQTKGPATDATAAVGSGSFAASAPIEPSRYGRLSSSSSSSLSPASISASSSSSSAASSNPTTPPSAASTSSSSPAPASGKRPRDDNGMSSSAAVGAATALKAEQRASKKTKFVLRNKDAAAPATASDRLGKLSAAANKSQASGANATLFPTVPKKLRRNVGKAVTDWGMIREGDRILVGLSGGKDSLTLLHALHALQQRSRISWELGAVTVDPGTDAFDPSPLKAYMQALGIPYFYLGERIFDRAKVIMQGMLPQRGVQCARAWAAPGRLCRELLHVGNAEWRCADYEGTLHRKVRGRARDPATVLCARVRDQGVRVLGAPACDQRELPGVL